MSWCPSLSSGGIYRCRLPKHTAPALRAQTRCVEHDSNVHSCLHQCPNNIGQGGRGVLALNFTD